MSLSEFRRFARPGAIDLASESIAAVHGEVLPRLDVPALCDALRRLPPGELEEALQTKLLPLVVLPGVELFAACGRPALRLAEDRGLKVIAYADAAAFIAAVRAVHGRRLAAGAAHGLRRQMPEFSAGLRLTAAQSAVAVLLAALAVAGLLVLPLSWSWAIGSLISGLMFGSVVALRLLCLMPLPGARRRRAPPPELDDADLPVYTVLVPLFGETSVLRQLLAALEALDYPRRLLDIKLILEESDIAMQRAVAEIVLPAHYEVLVVPAGRPQTKPRALNYGLQFSRGELLTIYDAEDIPDPHQLRAAAERFAVAAPELACLQAQLTFYNPHENWITRQFTAEYALLFMLLLPALAAHRLPLPLGGTSNHFRVSCLREAGGWDAHNVTEDADLGLRLARFGYDTGTFDSVTHEEANTRLLNWMKQRGRWLKGFLATWLVHMRSPRRLWRELGPAGFWVAQAATFGVFASALLHPLCLAGTVLIYLFLPPLPSTAGFAMVGLAGLNLFILVAGYGITLRLAAKAMRMRGLQQRWLTLLGMPVYWMMISAAAWYALWQFVTRPHFWNKTEHGLSKVKAPGAK